MKQNIQQVHIIPFDLGCVFFDVLAINNTKNLNFTKFFINRLKESYKDTEAKIEFRHDDKGKVIDFTLHNSKLADKAIAVTRLDKTLYCYLLENGIGVFVYADLDGDAIKSTYKEISKYNNVLIANYQKKVTQSTLLNKFSNPAIDAVRDKMTNFMKTCWSIVSEGINEKLTYQIRPHSSNALYKANGLSYVLSIYLVEPKDFTSNELNHLMCSTFLDRSVFNNKNWKSINEKIKSKALDEPEIYKRGPNNALYFSWSACAATINQNIDKYEDLENNELLKALIKAEIYVQSRWFIADNSMDNVNKSKKLTLEELQKISSLIEFYQAELDNQSSANMTTLYKDILKKVVKASDVKNLYSSVKIQVNTQTKLMDAHNQGKKRRNKLIADLFLAIFTATSLYKTVMDLINGTFSWVNIVVLVAMTLVAVGTIIFNYKNK